MEKVNTNLEKSEDNEEELNATSRKQSPSQMGDITAADPPEVNGEGQKEGTTVHHRTESKNLSTHIQTENNWNSCVSGNSGSALNEPMIEQYIEEWLDNSTKCRPLPAYAESIASNQSVDLPVNFSYSGKQIKYSVCKIHKHGKTFESVNSSKCNNHPENDRRHPTHNHITDDDWSMSNFDSGVWETESESCADSCEYVTSSPLGEKPVKQTHEKTNQQEFRSESQKKNNSVWIWKTFLAVVLLAFVLNMNPKGHEEHEHHHELRLMLVGKTGAGKSASGNTILGEEFFRVEASPVSVTAQCENRSNTVNGRNITVIDTPGLMDTWLISDQTAHSAPNCIFTSADGPHIFLLVITLGRFTDEERNAVKWIQENFGEEAMKFTLILFTGGDLLGGKPVEKFISNSYELQNLVDAFEGRFHVFNNNNKDSRSQVTELFKKIDLILYEFMGYSHMKEVFQRAKNTRKGEERKQIILEKEITMEERKRAEMESLTRQEEEVKKKQISRKIKEEEIRNITSKEEEVKQEEEDESLMPRILMLMKKQTKKMLAQKERVEAQCRMMQNLDEEEVKRIVKSFNFSLTPRSIALMNSLFK